MAAGIFAVLSATASPPTIAAELANGAEISPPQASQSPLESLVNGPEIGADELGISAARGLPTTLNDAVSQANVVGSGTVTGTISNIGSVNGNSGFTTIFQNTGNNSVFQASTIVNISIK